MASSIDSNEKSPEEYCVAEDQTRRPSGLRDRRGMGDAVVTSTGLFSTKATRGATFEHDDTSERFYKPIDSFEGIHRWDPDFEWEPKEEKRVVRRINWRICLWVCVMFFALQLDRGNISQALSDDMLEDLDLSTNDYNTGQSIFYVCFLFAELPSQLISKKVGPDNWIPIQMVSWSLVASFQALLSGKSSFWTCRALLGLIEGELNQFFQWRILCQSITNKTCCMTRRFHS